MQLLHKSEKLSDFLAFIRRHPEKLRCPFCSARITSYKLTPNSFEIDRTGRLELYCPNTEEHDVVVEAVG